MSLKLIHTFDDRIDLYFGDMPLFTYVYISRASPLESPRPYFHPVRTLDGDVLTNFRPNDHRWHHGISMTVPSLSGDNFWGGKSFVRGQGYVQLDNNGQQRHVDWESITCADDRAEMRQRIDWISYAGQHWIEETRRVAVEEINAQAGYWTLDIGLSLYNVRDEALVFGSPATEGRPDGVGYGGLFWRGARDLTGGLIMMADGAESSKNDMEVMGHRGPWMAFTGKHDGVDHHSTVVLIDRPGNLRYPTRWFARTETDVCGSFAFAYDQTYTLDAGAALGLNYRYVFANGAWTRGQVEALVARM